MAEERNPALNRISAAWGILGVIAVLMFAVVRLAPIALQAIVGGLNLGQWALLAANVGFMAWSEGYVGFQQRFSPRVAARALYLCRNDMPISTLLLAPFFCCGYFCATRRVRFAVWMGTCGIILLVLAVHQLSQPWRGILDAGVVVGLSWGLLSLIFHVFRAFTSERFDRSPEMP
jgi:hypothetical protein